MHVYFHEQNYPRQRGMTYRFLLFMQVQHICFTDIVAIKVSPPVYQCICFFSALECH